jgi:SAM-dependent methyltransferase
VLSRLKQRLRAGISAPLGEYELTLLRVRRVGPVSPSVPSGERAKAAKAPVDLAKSAAHYLAERFPQLRELELPLETDSEQILAAFHAALLTFYPQARGVALRNTLAQLREASASPAIKASATRAIAVSDLADGMPDRSRMLRDDAKWGARWREEAAALDAAYGAPIATRDWSDRSRDASICWYFEAHPEQARGKSVLHIAPEPGLRALLKDMAREYISLDATGGADIDHVADLCDIGLPPNRFDLVVCHRVLEHVTDDLRAMREIHRVAKPGGALQLSVPQAVHRPSTLDWIVPDLTQHRHVRLYGADLSARLETAGFRVALEDWLLRKSDTEWAHRKAYPMRVYCARKIA